MEKQHNSHKPEKYHLLLILIILILIVWICSYWFIDWLNPSEGIGVLGDSFGVINSLFSGFAFAGIIYTIYLQRKELTIQRQELSETRQELKRTADAQEKSEKALSLQMESLKYTAKLTALNSLVEFHIKEYQIARERNDNRGMTDSDLKKREYLKLIENILKDMS